jgi:protease II
MIFSKVPYKYGSFYYYTRTVKDLAYKLHCRYPCDQSIAQEQIILDENEVALELTYCDVGECEPSPCHTQLAYSVDTVGEIRSRFSLPLAFYSSSSSSLLLSPPFPLPSPVVVSPPAPSYYSLSPPLLFYYSLSPLVVSSAPTYDFLLSIDINIYLGDETYDVIIRDLRTGTDIDKLEQCAGDLIWGADSSTLFYVKMDDEHRPFEVWMHQVG